MFDTGSPISPLLRWGLAVGGLLNLSFWGFGYNWMQGVAAASCFLTVALWGKHISSVVACYIAFGLLLIFPELGMLHGVLVAAIWLITKDLRLISPVLLIWLMEELPMPLGDLAFSPFVRVGICGFAIFAILRLPRLILPLYLSVVAVTLLELFKGPRFDSIESYPEIGIGYVPGHSTWRAAGHKGDAPNTGMSPLRGYLHGSREESHRPGVVMVEHDQWEGRRDEPLAPANLQVEVPWHDNCWPGRQYLRHAISADGFLSSNLGGALSDEGRVELCYWDNGTLRPVVVSRGDVTWTSDSDFLNNALTVYNSTFVTEFNRGGLMFYVIRIANLVLASVFLVSSTIYAAPALMFIVAFLPLSRPGDIRIAGGVGDPHDESGASGVLESINSEGIVALPGVLGARVLVVPPGRVSLHMGEKIVILGGGSRLITLSHGTVRADDLPMGPTRGIPDARHLSYRDLKGVTELVLPDGTKVIGTSSPGKLQWKSLYR